MKILKLIKTISNLISPSDKNNDTYNDALVRMADEDDRNRLLAEEKFKPVLISKSKAHLEKICISAKGLDFDDLARLCVEAYLSEEKNYEKISTYFREYGVCTKKTAKAFEKATKKAQGNKRLKLNDEENYIFRDLLNEDGSYNNLTLIDYLERNQEYASAYEIEDFLADTYHKVVKYNQNIQIKFDLNGIKIDTE